MYNSKDVLTAYQNAICFQCQQKFNENQQCPFRSIFNDYCDECLATARSFAQFVDTLIVKND